MNESIPEEPERAYINRLVVRYAGQEVADQVLSTATSWWDWASALTQAANRVTIAERRRRLQVEGGALLEKFLP